MQYESKNWNISIWEDDGWGFKYFFVKFKDYGLGIFRECDDYYFFYIYLSHRGLRISNVGSFFYNTKKEKVEDEGTY